MMMRAGFRSQDAIQVVRGVKLLLPIVLVSLVLITGIYHYSPIFIVLGASGRGLHSSGVLAQPAYQSPSAASARGACLMASTSW